MEDIEPLEEGAGVIEPRIYELEPRLDQSKLIHPTEDEYNELQKNDVHPDSFDRATIKRLRNSGASHDDIKDAAAERIPYEDYETAREYNKDHSSAIQEALKYRESARTTALNQKKWLLDNGEDFNNNNPTMSPEEHLEAVTKLFNHHAAKRNRPSEAELPIQNDNTGYYDPDDSGVHLETSDRKRAHEWIMNECAKLEPSLKPLINTQTEFNPKHLLGLNPQPEETNGYDVARQTNRYYDDPMLKLMDHHMNKYINAPGLPYHFIQKRMMQSLQNIGSSMHSPMDYRHELYEEE